MLINPIWMNPQMHSQGSQAINICFLCFHHLQLSRTEQPPWSVPLRRSPCFPGRETLPGRRPMWPGMDGGNPRYLGCRSYRDILNVFLWIYYSIHTQKHTHIYIYIYIYIYIWVYIKYIKCRNISMDLNMYVHTYINVYIYICIVLLIFTTNKHTK